MLNSVPFLGAIAIALSLTLSGQVAANYQCNHGACVLVVNECPFPLYMQRTLLDGDDNRPHTVHVVERGEAELMDITGWNNKPGQRLYAWWQNPIGAELHPLQFRDKVEINWCGNRPDRMCYNPTAVDYLGLPVTMGPYHKEDCPSVAYTGQDMLRVSDIKNECPTKFVQAGVAGVCMSPYQLCLNEPGDRLCRHLDPVLAECKQRGECPGDATTTQAYGCSDWFSQQPEVCAALNRGLYPNDVDNQRDLGTFYRSQPFSEYAQFVHSGNRKHYAFAYDDVGGQGTSGYNECHTNFLSVTFCPSS